MTATIRFRLRGTQQIIYVVRVQSLEMQFRRLILGFRRSPYYVANHNVQHNYFVGQNRVPANSMRSLTELGLVDGGFVDAVARILD